MKFQNHLYTSSVSNSHYNTSQHNNNNNKPQNYKNLVSYLHSKNPQKTYLYTTISSNFTRNYNFNKDNQYLNQNQGKDKQQKHGWSDQHSQVLPLIRRNKSYDTFDHILAYKNEKSPMQTERKYMQFLKEQKNKFESSRARYSKYSRREDQNEQTSKYPYYPNSYNNIESKPNLQLEYQVLHKQNQRLKEQIKYLKQKCKDLEQKNELLLRNQSKLQILERQYELLTKEKYDYRNKPKEYNNQFNHNNSNYIINQSQIAPMHMIYSFKNNLNFDSQMPISPIYKIQNSSKIKQYAKWNTQSFLQSKINNNNQKQPFINQRSSQLKNQKYQILQNKLKAIEQQSISTKKQLVQIIQSKQQAYIKLMKQLEVQRSSTEQKDRKIQQQDEFIKQMNRQRQSKQKLRETEASIVLNKQKIKYEQMMNALLANEKQRQKSHETITIAHKELKDRLQSEIQKLKITNQELRIKMIELQQQVENRKVQCESLRDQKTYAQRTMRQRVNSNENNSNKRKEEWQKILKQRDENMKKVEEMNRKLIEQLDGKKQQKQSQSKEIKSLQQEMLKYKSKVLRQCSVETQMTYNQLFSIQRQLSFLRQQHSKYIITLQEISHLKVQAQKYRLAQEQIQKLKRQILVFIEDHARIKKQLQFRRVENIKMHELDSQWKAIEGTILSHKRRDIGIDHLWTIKQVQYNNIHELLQKIRQ